MPAFKLPLTALAIESGTPNQWSLGEVIEGSFPLSEIKLEPDALLVPYLSLFTAQNGEYAKISYSGDLKVSDV